MKKVIGLGFVGILMLSFCLVIPLLAQEKKTAEEVYTVKKGDTLWDISSRFLNNPYLWPKLWQRNSYITNPHWIYPGRPILLTPIEEVKQEEPKPVVAQERPREVAKEPKVEAPPAENVPQVVAEPRPEEKKPMGFPEVRSAGFFSDIDYSGIGVILDSRDAKNIMAEMDIVYVTFKTAESVSVGNKYTIFRPSELIRHPITGKRIGRRYNIIGNLQVIDQHGNFFTAKVTESFDGIEIGDRIQPYRND
jgi:hypothetical protein